MIEQTRCRLCRCYLDQDDLFCGNCGTENPTGTDMDGVGAATDRSSSSQQASLLSFRCNQCGASMSYDASAKGLRCPFCGSEQMTARSDARTLRPDRIVPFSVDRQVVEQVLRQWLARGIWRPGDAAQRSVIDKVTQVYVPFWVFNVQTETAWTADSSSVPAGARGSWLPVSGTTGSRYDHILVGASGTLMPREIEEIVPFDLAKTCAPEQIDLTNVIVEEFRTTRRDARLHAAAIVETMESNRASQLVSGSARNVRVNVRVSDMSSVPILLPVWIMVYQYNQHPYRVLVNGQTGEVCGTAPFSYAKLSAAVAIAILVGLLMLIVVVFAMSQR